MPVGFVSFGSPSSITNLVKGQAFFKWARTFPRPKAILVISNRWVTPWPTLGTIISKPLIYDFQREREDLYQIQYSAPAAIELAEKLKGILKSQYGECHRDLDRGWDSGVWGPLYQMFPYADIPVLQMSLPSQFTPTELIQLGKLIAPLRKQKVLILTTGAITQKNEAEALSEKSSPPAWAVDFDRWCERVLLDWNVKELVGFNLVAKGYSEAHPTEEPFLPLLIAVGAGIVFTKHLKFPIVGFEPGGFSRRCVQFG